MTFVFDEDAGSGELVIKNETYKYLVKVRRHQVGDEVAFRQPSSTEYLHTYRLASIDGRQARLELVESKVSEVAHGRKLHLGWCVIDGKSVEKVLPMLNEIGVDAITFVYSDRSQKQFRPDLKRYERILHSSMQQCGRSRMMAFHTSPNLKAFIDAHHDYVAFDFCDRIFDGTASTAATVLIGPEGGFSDAERAMLNPSRVYRLATPTILRSETAAVAVCGKILL